MQPTIACTRLHSHLHRLPRYKFPCPDSVAVPDGVYFIFEEGETCHSSDRIVRVGSHTGTGNLLARLREHLTHNKDRSIFRKNIGRALLSRDGDPFLADWNLDLTSRRVRESAGRRVNLVKQADVEEAVSRHIQTKMSFCVIPVSKPLEFEKACIGTVSLCEECHPSNTWLGQHSPVAPIRESGLWQVQHLYKNLLGPDELDALT